MRFEITMERLDDDNHKHAYRHMVEKELINPIEVIDMLARTLVSAGFDIEEIMEDMEVYLDENTMEGEVI